MSFASSKVIPTLRDSAAEAVPPEINKYKNYEMCSLDYREFCLNLGASSGEIRSEDIFTKIQNWAPQGADIILDPVGANYFEKNLSVLGMEGRLVIIGLMGGAQSNINLGHLMIKRQRVIGSTIRARSKEIKNEVMKALEDKVLPLFDSGVLKPIVHQVLPLSDCTKAHEIMESNENIGKIILNLE